MDCVGRDRLLSYTTFSAVSSKGVTLPSEAGGDDLRCRGRRPVRGRAQRRTTNAISDLGERSGRWRLEVRELCARADAWAASPGEARKRAQAELDGELAGRGRTRRPTASTSPASRPTDRRSSTPFAQRSKR